MNWTLEQTQRINDLQNWYKDKTNKVLDALENGKITVENYWSDCRKMLGKRALSDRQLKEWQIVFENMEDIIYNRYRDY